MAHLYIFVHLLYFIVALNSVTSNNCPEIVTKKEWGGRRGYQAIYTIIPVEYVVIHHTVTPTCVTTTRCTTLIQSIQNFHMDELEFHDIGYNFLIGGNGNVYEGVGWLRVGAHTKKYNTRSIGIALTGNFMDKLPNINQLLTLKQMLACGVEEGYLNKNYKLIGARQVSSTQSPGGKLFNEIRKWPHFERNPPKYFKK